MEITLPPSTAERIRETLGDDVDLSPGAVPSALARLAVEAPAVYSQVLAELSGSRIRLDSERELAKRRRRSLLRRLVFWWGEYESDVGDRLIAKRHVAAAVPLVMAGLILLLLVVSGAMGRRSPAASRPALATRTAFAAHRSERPRRAPHPARPVPPLPDLVLSDPAAFLPPPSGPAPQAPPRLSPPDGSAPGNPLVLDLGRIRPPVRSPKDGGVRVLPMGAPVVYDRDADHEAAHGAAPDGPPGSRHESPIQGVLDASPEPAGGRWAVGQRIPARLATGVVVVAGGPPVPAVAEGVGDGATWLGSATLGPEGLVQITLTPASRGGSAAVRGIALDPGRLVPGLSGRTTFRHPEAAAAALGAALRAAAEYARALAVQGQVTLGDGWAQLALGQPAPAWTYLAAHLADGIGPRGDVQGPLETTEVVPGTPLVILVTEAP